jgi:hypothetical protein
MHVNGSEEEIDDVWPSRVEFVEEGLDFPLVTVPPPGRVEADRDAHHSSHGCITRRVVYRGT